MTLLSYALLTSPRAQQMPSGNGGDGGNATVDVTLDPAADAPAQYVVTLTAGAAGAAAAHGTSHAGRPGTASMRIRLPGEAS
jgi:hypothetical protein